MPFPSPGDLPNPGIEPRSPAFQEDSFPAELQGKSKNAGLIGILERLKAEGERDPENEMARWHHRLNGHEFE